MITDEAVKVNNAFGFFQDCFIQDWINTNRASLASGSFDDFIDALKSRFLPRNWDSTARNRIFNTRLTPKANFDNWVMSVKKMNLALKGTTSHFNDTKLRGLLDSLIDEELHRRCSNRKILENVNSIDIADIEGESTEARADRLAQKRLDTWIQEVSAIAHERQDEMRRYKQYHDELARPLKRPHTTGPPRGNSQRNVSSSSTNTRRFTGPKLPPITDDERALLLAHEGCLKCRIGYAGHIGKYCPDGFPQASTYVPRMEEMMHQHHAAAIARQQAVALTAAPATANSSAEIVAALGFTNASEPLSDSASD